MLWSCYRYYFPLMDLHLKRKKVNPLIQLVSRSVLTQSWGREQKLGLSSPWQQQDWKQGDQTSQSGSEADWFWFKSLKIEFLIAIGTTGDCLVCALLSPCRSCVWALPRCEHGPVPPCHLLRGSGLLQHHPCPASTGEALRCSALCNQMCHHIQSTTMQMSQLTPNVHWKGTDISPSPNSSLVSHVQGRHELEEIMVSGKS